MDKTITGAIIGASAAIIINGIIFLLSRRNEINREKIQVISEIISCLYSQLRYSERFVQHRTWMNYYYKAFPNIEDSVLSHIANNKIGYEVNSIEQIEMKFINIDSKLATLTAKYRSIFTKDKIFTASIKEIIEYTISDNVSIEDFEDWDNKLFEDSSIMDTINKEVNKSLKTLDESFKTKINYSINYLENKI